MGGNALLLRHRRMYFGSLVGRILLYINTVVTLISQIVDY